MNILHIDCSPRRESHSRQLSAAIVKRLLAVAPEASVYRRDLASVPIPHVAPDYATALSSPATLAAPPQGALDFSEMLIQEVEAADAIVIGTPMYNLTVPSVLKAWIDRILRAGRTFKSTPAGKAGMLRDRPVFVGIASGGVFTGERANQPDFLTPYLSVVLGSIGLKTLQFFPIQATAFLDQDQAAVAREAALATMDVKVLGGERTLTYPDWKGKKMTLHHPIFERWPARQPHKLQLFSLPTPNGVKVGIMLEETGLDYEPHRIDITANESHDPAFLALNPNGKIPAIYDPNGPGGRPLALFESGAILIYLAEKTNRFLSADPHTRYETIQWLMWQMGGVGPMFGQVGFFNKFAGKAYEDKRPLQRYATESARLLGVLDERLAGRDWVMGADYSIADISLLGWVRNLITFYEARELVGFDRFQHVRRWLDRGLARPGVQRGLQVTAA